MITIILFASFIIFMAIGMPIAMSLGVASVIAIFKDGTIPFTLVAQKMFSANDSFSLLAIPFFMLAGSVMTQGGISRRLIRVANAFIGHWTGGLGLVATVTSMFFAAISGSSAATTASVGATMIPEMEKKGYPKDFSSAVVAAAGTTGLVIPPSTSMIVYGVAASVSIGKLFMGGFVPGILMGVAMMIVIYATSKKNHYGGGEKADTAEKIAALKDGIWGMLMPVIVLGGIYGGIFTPTESAAVACFYGLIVSVFIYKEVDLKSLIRILENAAVNTAMVMLIMSGATLFGYIIIANRVPQILAEAILQISTNKYVIMLLINIFLLFIGCFLNASAAISILAPILLPVVKAVGYDPVAFGVIMTVNLAIGTVTPPVGLDLFVAQGISGVPLEKIAHKVLPLLAALLCVLMFISFFPATITFLAQMVK